MSYRKVPATTLTASPLCSFWVRPLRLASALLAVCLMGSAAQAATTFNWIGGNGSSWSNAANWDVGTRAPGTGGTTDDIVIIPPGDSPTTININSGTYTIGSLNCGRNLNIPNGGTILNITDTVNPSVISGDLSLLGNGAQGAVLGGAATVTINGTLNWNSAGTMQGGGKTIIGPAGVLNMSGNVSLLNRTLVNQSTSALSTITGSIFFNNGSTFTNDTGAQFTVMDSFTSATTSLSQGGTGTNAFINNGTVIRTDTQSFVINVACTNSGTFDIQSGTVDIANAFSNFANNTLTGGTYIVADTLKFASANIVTDAANIILDGPNSAIQNRSTGADALANLATIAATGTLTLNNGRNLTPAAAGLTVAGALGGIGTITGNVTNNGNVSPGLSPGILTITGNYVQQAGGTLNIELGGLTAGTQFDQLQITGTAALAGTLNATLINGYSPAANDTFQIMTFASSTGGFTTVNAPCLSTSSAPTSLSLVAGGGLPAPTNPAAQPPSICGGGSSVLSATPGAGGEGVEWSADSCGGTALPGGATPTVSPTVTTTYYARTTGSSGGCGGGAACASVTVTVADTPEPPTGAQATPPDLCGPGGSVQLSATPGTGGDTVDWYTDACGQTLVPGGATPTVSPAATTTYYARSRNSAAGCVSATCVPVTVTISAMPAVPTNLSATPPEICTPGVAVHLAATPGAGGDTVDWFTDACGQTPVPGGATPTVTPATTTIYFARSRNSAGGCVGTACTSITVTVGAPQPGDLNGDCQINSDDVAAFMSCFSGPSVPYAPGCAAADLDQDNDVDQDDFGILQRLYIGSPKAPVDFNSDGHVDNADWQIFVACFSGPGVPQPQTHNCLKADLDHDGDVDMNDCGLFQRCFSGPDKPADPNCLE